MEESRVHIMHKYTHVGTRIMVGQKGILELLIRLIVFNDSGGNNYEKSARSW